MENIPCFPGWKIVKKIGRGHFGTVYEIEHESDGDFGTSVEHSAMKAIPVPPEEDLGALQSEYSDDDVTTLLRSRVNSISEEFGLMAQLQGHSNIVNYHDHAIIQRDDQLGWDVLIRMELLTPLSAYSKGKAMDEEEVISLGLDMCRALKRCEECGVLHRDIKPQNIFVNRYGDFKLGDFGIARATEHLTASSVAGTYDYMAPEIVKQGKYDNRVDIYSLGLVLYKLLNENRGPFLPLPPEVPDITSQNAAMKRRMDGEALLPPAHGSAELQYVVLKACAYKPEDRYQSAAEFYDALKRLDETIPMPYVDVFFPPVQPTSPETPEKPKAPTENNPESASSAGEVEKPVNRNPESGSASGGEVLLTPVQPASPETPEKPSETDNGETISAFGDKSGSGNHEPKPTSSSTSQEGGKREATKKSKKSLFLVIAAACVAVVLVGVVGYFNCWFGHRWDDGAVIKAATHTATGAIVYTCSNCGQNKEETIAQLTTHTYDQETVDAQYLKTEATCTDPAVYYKSCECGEAGTETFTYGEAKGHSWDEGVVTVAATYTNVGTRTYTCSTCGQTRQETIAKITLIASGTCGDNLTWILDNTGTLIISGIGAMLDYTYNTYNEAPWCDQLDSIQSVVIEDGITHVGNYSFSRSSCLSSVTIPDSVTSIGESAFSNCTNLTSVNIPNSITSIGITTFSGCSGLQEILVDAGNQNYTSEDGILFSKDKSKIICYPAGHSGTSYVIPNSVTTIGWNAFYGCSNLTNVTIPDSVISIGNNAFFHSGLTSIVIPDSVTYIATCTFSGCSNLTSVTISNSVTTLEVSTFIQCSSLTTVIIPDGVTSIKDSVFSSCSSLASVTIPSSVTSIGKFAFDDCTSLENIYYSGTENDRNQIEIENSYNGNAPLLNAAWHYNS